MAGDIGEEAARSLSELLGLQERLSESVSKSVELPEPGQNLDYEKHGRKSSDERVFKHILQSCMMHRENFVAGNQIKIPYLIDGFLAMLVNKNSYGMYTVARSMLELSGFLHEIQSRLEEITLRVDGQTWKPLGEKYFGIIVRARFATAHPGYREMLRQSGVSESRLKPFNIMNCIEGLAREPGHEDAVMRYAILCDFVHHNLGSSTLSNSGSGVSDRARFEGGGEIASVEGWLTITRYEYPVDGKLEITVNDLARSFLNDALACVGWLNTTPGSPYPHDMVVARTGTEFGIPILPRDSA